MQEKNGKLNAGEDLALLSTRHNDSRRDQLRNTASNGAYGNREKKLCVPHMKSEVYGDTEGQ